jgi:hypothetical protein
MSKYVRRRLLTAVATAFVVGAVASPVGAQTGAAERPSTEPYVPWVTDFGRTPQPEEYIPFITDFGRTLSPAPSEPVAAPAAAPAAAPDDGLYWRDVAIGAAFGIGFAILVAGSWLAVRPRLRRAGHAATEVQHQPGS